MLVKQIKNKSEVPFELLELADPSSKRIKEYVEAGTCYVVKVDSKVIGVVVLIKINAQTCEVKNISVTQEEQRKGIGRYLLRFAESKSLELGFHKLRIGTGNSSLNQLALYQKVGFEICGIQKNFFIKNYSQPIFENGIQCKHLILLEKKIK